MPFIAELDDGSDVTPAVASREMNLTCRECNNPLTLVERHERGGSMVASHFRHPSANSGGGGGSGDCGGESPTHEKMKSIAADRLRYELDDLGGIVEISEVHIDSQYVGDRLPDVLVIFDEPTHPYGRGIGVECQYRHEDKDKEATERAFLAEGYTTLWLEKEAFDLDGLDVNLEPGDGAEWVNVWPNAVPDRRKWTGPEYQTHKDSIAPWDDDDPRKELCITPRPGLEGEWTGTPEANFAIERNVPATIHLDAWSHQLDDLPPVDHWGLKGYITAPGVFEDGILTTSTLHDVIELGAIGTYLDEPEPERGEHTTIPVKLAEDPINELKRGYNPPPYKKRACPEGEHDFVPNGFGAGYRECDKCGLSPQTLADDLGQRNLTSRIRDDR